MSGGLETKDNYLIEAWMKKWLRTAALADPLYGRTHKVGSM